MMISSNRLLDYVFTKASEGDVRAKITYEYLRPLFEQGKKKGAIDRKLEYIERCERIHKAIVGGASYNKEDEKKEAKLRTWDCSSKRTAYKNAS